MRDYIRRLLNQKDPKLNNIEIQRSAIYGVPAESEPDKSLQNILNALDKKGVDTSRGLEGLRLYPEYREEILATYFDFFPKLDDDMQAEIANEIVNQKPGKSHLESLISAIESVKGMSTSNQLSRWVLAQPIGRLITSTRYEDYRRLLQDLGEGNFRMYIAEKLYKVTDYPGQAYSLAIELLKSKDFETVYGALNTIIKIGLNERDKPAVEALLKRPEPVLKKKVLEVLDNHS